MLRRRLTLRIEQASDEACAFVESCFMPIAGFFGLPEYRGRQRVTECGGTSSGIGLLGRSGPTSPGITKKMHAASEWLAGRQKDGAWESSGFRCAEITAVVLNDLFGSGLLSAAAAGAALEYLGSCYRDGHYSSVPCCDERPHVFTTCAAVEAVASYSCLAEPHEVRQWLDEARTPEGHWGPTFKCDHASVVHTAFALSALRHCLGSWESVAEQYKDQVGWLRRKYREATYCDDMITAPTGALDDDGQVRYWRVRITHMGEAVVGKALVGLRCHGEALSLTHRLIASQSSGAWGPRNDCLTMWATNQAVGLLTEVRRDVLPHSNDLVLAASTLGALPAWVPTAFAFLAVGVLGSAAFFIPAARTELLVTGVFALVGAVWRLRTSAAE